MRWHWSQSFALVQTLSPKKKLQLGGGYENFKGDTLTVTACVSNAASRYAMPTIPDLVYAALLYPDNKRPENPSSEKFVEGVPNGSGDKFVFLFQRPDEFNEIENVAFTLEVFAFVKTNVEADAVADDGTSNFSINSAPFSKAKSGLEIVGDAINMNETIVLEVNKLSTEKGEVNLKVTVPDGCLLEIDDTAKENFKCEIESETSNTFAITANGISNGVHPVTFTLKKDGEIIYIFTENINVFKMLCTDTWGGLERDTPKEITQDMISTTVYVRGTGEGWYTKNDYRNITGDDENSGSLFSPFATIQKAVDTVIARNAFTSNFTIYLDGTFTAASSAALADFSGVLSALSVRIAGFLASKKAVLDGNNTARGIVVGSSDGSSVTQKDVNLTLENLIVQNTKYSSGRGGGITLCCESTNKHTIKNCEIKNNNASYGSAIYNEYGSLDLQSCEISDNTTGTSGTVYNGYESAILTMSDDVKIENNSANNGGGVFLANDSTLKISDASVVIKGNSSSSLSRGKGICLWNGILELSGSAKIDDGIGFPNDSSSANHKIVISGALTAASPVATITPASYKAESPVLSAGTDVQITQDLCDKFSLTNSRYTIIPSADKTLGVLARLDYIFLKSSSGDDGNSGLLSESNAVKTLSRAVELYDKYDSQEIRVDAQYTLSSEESDLLNRTNKKHLTLKRTSPVYMFYISQGDVTISNVTLDGNDHVGSSEGILYITGLTTIVTFGDGAILRDGLGNKGGAVHIDSGHLNMVGGEITGSITDNQGGGVFVNSNGKFTMSGGIISGNYNRSSSVKTSGAIYQNGTLEISGSASIPAGDEGKNDVYLASGKTICVTGELGAESPVATITPYAYTENRPLLSAGEGVTLNDNICNQFAVTPQDDGTEWRVALDGANGTGVLQKVVEDAD